MTKKKQRLLKLLIVLILVLIIACTFAGSFDETLAQMKETSIKIMVLIGCFTVIYHMCEGWITYSLAKRYNPEFKYRTGVEFAFYCSFYRLSTLGSGQGVAAVVFLGRHKVKYSEATGLYMIQYMIHKVSIAIFCGVVFIVNREVMWTRYHSYVGYLIAAFILTVLISIGLVLLAVSVQFHRLLFYLIGKVNKSGRFDAQVEKLRDMAQILEQSSKKLLTDVKTIIGMVLKNMLKFCFWYGIPYLVLLNSHGISFLDSLSVTSLGVLTASVIPTPAGIGSSELIMTLLFRPLVGPGKAAAVTLLYRLATFIFPFIVGGSMLLIVRLVTGRTKKKGE